MGEEDEDEEELRPRGADSDELALRPETAWLRGDDARITGETEVSVPASDPPC